MFNQTTSQDIQSGVTKAKRSVKLNPTERKELNKYAKKFDTALELCEDLGISKNTLRTVLAMGTCNSDTKRKILDKLNAA